MEKQGRRERNKIRCRQRILRASRQLFSAKGYEETTMDDVAERSEVSKATLYNYFPGKDRAGVLHDIKGQLEGKAGCVPSVSDNLNSLAVSFAALKSIAEDRPVAMSEVL